uniref:SM24 protein n=1 Tax=Ophiomastix wendtii TaxID=7623 RepID=A0A0K0M9G3_9ECHI|nr:SM24 protein [Ophiomastix wendtii]
MRLLILAAVVTLAYGHSACPPLWTHLGDSCYRFFPDRLRWEDAKTTCGQFAPCSAEALGQLVKIADAQVNEFLGIYLNSFVPQPPATDFWIGASDLGLEGRFTNVDGTPVTFTNWAQGQPDNGAQSTGQPENCVMYGGETKLWSDASCAMMMPYICMMPAEKERFPRLVPPIIPGVGPTLPNNPQNPQNPNQPGQGPQNPNQPGRPF